MRFLLASLAVTVLAVSTAYAGPGSAGATISEARATGAFHGVSISTVMEVEITVGTATSVELRGPKDWLARIETKVKDGILVVSMPGNIKAKKIPRIRAVITTPDLGSIAVTGVVDVKATEIVGKSFDVEVSGVGSLELTGSVEALHVDVSGSGDLRAKNLVSRTAAVSISGSADVAIHATRRLDASISGSGEVKVYGKPATVNKDVSGSGSIELE